MSTPREPSILDAYWARLPDGDPADILERAQAMRLADAIRALPPTTRLPLVGWRPAEAVAERLARGDRAGLGDLYRGLGLDDRAELVSLVAEQLGEQGTQQWVEARPEDPVGLLVRAQQLQAAAWSSAREQGPDGHEEFATVTLATQLGWAAELCERAAAGLADDPTPWVVATRTVLGEVGDVSRAARRWREVAPFSFAGHAAVVDMLAEEASGVPGAALAHARVVHETAPGGHPVHALVCKALCQDYAHRVREGDAPAEADEAFQSEIDLIRAAHAASVAHPRWRVTWREGLVRNLFAFCAFFGDDDPLAWAEVQATCGHLTEHPWALKWGDGVLSYERARAWLVRTVVQP